MCKDCGVVELAQGLEEAARALVRGEIAVSGQGEVLVAADMARDAAEILQLSLIHISEPTRPY